MKLPLFDTATYVILAILALYTLVMIFTGPRIIGRLILVYLRKRRIAWVSLIAVTICTAMVLVVISVMGGWLRMFRQSFHGLSGDVIVAANSMQGFPFYDDMIRDIEALPSVGQGNAVPVIQTFGLINIMNNGPEGVQVLGYPIDKIGHVNEFPQSLYRQFKAREEAADKLKDPKLTPADREYYTKLANDKAPPSFDVVKDTRLPLAPLPPGLKLPDSLPPDLKSKIEWVPSEDMIIFHGEMTDDERDRLQALSSDFVWQSEMQELWRQSDLRRLYPKIKGADVRTWPGIILGEGVARIRKDKNNKLVGRNPTLYRVPVKLTVLGIPLDGGSIGVENKSERPYWVVDDSRTKVYQYDSNTVYVPFEVLQRDLGMDARPGEDGSPGYPARTTQLDIKVKPGYDLNKAREEIAAACENVVKRNEAAGKFYSGSDFRVQTWEESQRVWLGAIEKEKVLVTGLFGMISIVAVFLIFCIFYMIVVEKTRDIGIIKSVGATSRGVAAIFLGYGLAIGVVGSGLGFLIGWLIVHFINQLHDWLGRALGVVIWDPQVYAFDTIPNTMNPTEVSVILIVAILSAVFGALVPAIRAARLHPVEALRWE